MKIFKLIGMALFAIVMSVNFTACSGDDEEPKGEGEIENQTEKRISTLVVKGEMENTILNFVYDNQGRLSKVSEKDSWGSSYLYEYEWNENTISITEGGHLKSEAVLSNNKVKSYEKLGNEGYIYLLNYDAQGYLSNSDDGNAHYNFTWKEGNLNKVEGSYFINSQQYKEIYSISYKKSVVASGLNALVPFEDNAYENALGEQEEMTYLFAAHPNLFGKLSKNAPYQAYYIDEDYQEPTSTFEYNGEKFPTQITEKISNEEGVKTTYTITWE